MELSKIELAQLHELVFNSLEINLKTDDEIMKYWWILPNEIRKDFKHWGLSDTPTNDSAYEWLRNNLL